MYISATFIFSTDFTSYFSFSFPRELCNLVYKLNYRTYDLLFLVSYEYFYM